MASVTDIAAAPSAPGPDGARRKRWSLPEAIPPFNNTTRRLFGLVWALVFLLAVAGPIAGAYLRYTAPENNSQLLMGSRAGLAVAPDDATLVRFTVGPEAYKQGVRPGDRIVAIYGMPVPPRIKVDEADLASHADDPAYIMMGNLLFGTDSSEVPVTFRSPAGRTFETVLTSSESHIDKSAREIGIGPKVLKFIDLLHVLFYPFLLYAAWLLHRRNPRDAVSSLLSLAVLCTIAAEQPSSTFLATMGLPREFNVALFDLGNVLLLSGILLFPHGKLSPRLAILIGVLPVLFVLRGDVYQALFLGFMMMAVLILLRTLRESHSDELKQQIRWALFGFTGYAILRSLSILCDLYKWSATSFGQQIGIEVAAGIGYALGFFILQLGLLVALLRYRLYDADSIISKTASIAIVTIVVGGGFAGVMEGIITQMQNVYANAQTPAAIAGAILATVFIQPLHQKVERWVEKHFQKNLLELKHGLPEAMRDIRDVASLQDFIDDVLGRVAEGVRSDKVALVMGSEVMQQMGVTKGEVMRWLETFAPADDQKKILVDLDDRLFPLRVRIEDGRGLDMGWLLVGPRPDHSIAGKDEQEALEEVVVPLARSLRIVINREEEKQELLDILESHRARLERLELAQRL